MSSEKFSYKNLLIQYQQENKKSDIICIVGDGSLMMNIQELATLVHYNLNIKIIRLLRESKK